MSGLQRWLKDPLMIDKTIDFIFREVPNDQLPVSEVNRVVKELFCRSQLPVPEGAAIEDGVASFDKVAFRSYLVHIASIALQCAQKKPTKHEPKSTFDNLNTCIRIPKVEAKAQETDLTIQLSPIDQVSGGRGIPMIFFYKETLNVNALLASLEQVLVFYPVLSGRYNTAPPSAINLSNMGVPVSVHTVNWPVSEAVSHLPSTPNIFPKNEHKHYVPESQPGYPDPSTPDTPLLSVKITQFAGGGTAIGIIAQHRVVDGKAGVAFMKSWSQLFLGLTLETPPSHQRCVFDKMAAAELVEGDITFDPIPAGDQRLPPFMGVMPKITGDQSCVVPFSKSVLKEMKAAASVGIPDGEFVSTDDVLTAHVWQALCRMRCSQIGISTDSNELTVCMRAVDTRNRTNPPLGPGYFANASLSVKNALTVRELLASTPLEVSRRLRRSITNYTPEKIAAVCQWIRSERRAGNNPRTTFDSNALTFIFSSWSFDWEAADFGAKPICMDHGALIPIASVFTRRPKGDGVNVYMTGSKESLTQFIAELAVKK